MTRAVRSCVDHLKREWDKATEQKHKETEEPRETSSVRSVAHSQDSTLGEENEKSNIVDADSGTQKGPTGTLLSHDHVERVQPETKTEKPETIGLQDQVTASVDSGVASGGTIPSQVCWMFTFC